MFNTNAFGVVELSRYTTIIRRVDSGRAVDPSSDMPADYTYHYLHTLEYVHPKRTHTYQCVYASIPTEWVPIITPDLRRSLDITYFGIETPALHIPSIVQIDGIEHSHWIGLDYLERSEKYPISKLHHAIRTALNGVALVYHHAHETAVAD